MCFAYDVYLVLICVKRFPLYLKIGRIQSQYKGEIASMNTKGGCFYALIEKIFGRILTEKAQKITINKG